MTNGASQKTISPSTTHLPWPPPKQGVLIRVAQSSLAVYCILFGYSEWQLVNPRPWLYFRPMRCLRERTTGEPCGDMEKITLFLGLTDEVRHDAERIFTRLVAYLCGLAGRDAGAL